MSVPTPTPTPAPSPTGLGSLARRLTSLQRISRLARRESRLGYDPAARTWPERRRERVASLLKHWRTHVRPTLAPCAPLSALHELALRTMLDGLFRDYRRGFLAHAEACPAWRALLREAEKSVALTEFLERVWAYRDSFLPPPESEGGKWWTTVLPTSRPLKNHNK